MNVVDDALYDRLTGDAALTAALGTRPIVHAMQIPGGSEEFLCFGKQSGTDTYVQRQRAGRSLYYFVKMISKGLSVKAANDICDLVDAALTDKPLTLTGWTYDYLRRVSDIEYAEETNGVNWQHVGSLYQLELVPS